MEWRNPEPKIFSVLCVCVCLSVGHKNPTLPQYFFLCPHLPQLWVFFHFLTQLMGAFPLKRNHVRVFSSDSQPSKGSAHGSVHMIWDCRNHVWLCNRLRYVQYAFTMLINCWNRSNTSDFNASGNGFGWRTIITQGYICIAHFVCWMRAELAWLFFGRNLGIKKARIGALGSVSTGYERWLTVRLG